jgi:hypothetical protein
LGQMEQAVPPVASHTHQIPTYQSPSWETLAEGRSNV